MRSINASGIAAEREIHPERLDELSPDDARARRSRRDLRRIHRAMRSLAILLRAVGKLPLRAPPLRIIELGAGDGSLLLRLLRAMRARWHGGEVTLLDRQDLIDEETVSRFAQLGWTVRVVRADVREWVRSAQGERYDLCITTLFLHHLEAPALRELLGAIRVRADALIACEPRRNAVCRLGSRLVILLGASDVTRHDAVASVAAGFTADELSRLWTAGSESWQIEEYYAWPFTHCLVGCRSIPAEPLAP